MWSFGSGEESDNCVFVGLMCKLFRVAHSVISTRNGLRLFCAVCRSLCVEVIVMSSAYVRIFTSGVLGRGMSDVYRLKRKGEITLPCGTPVLRMRVCDFCPLYDVYACLPLM